MSWRTLSLGIVWGVSLSLHAQTYSLDWHVVAGGGGVSGGGDFLVSGTVGQAEAGPALTSASYTLEGGFWPGAVIPFSGELPTLSIQHAGAEVVISWTPPGNGFVLEMSDSLLSSEWLPAPGGNPATITPDGLARFFRLRRP